jgi:hypothetical protein
VTDEQATALDDARHHSPHEIDTTEAFTTRGVECEPIGQITPDGTFYSFLVSPGPDPIPYGTITIARVRNRERL